MKTILRYIVFSALSLWLTVNYFSGVSFDSSSNKVFALVAVGLALINIFSTPILKIMGFPEDGFGRLVLGLLINFVSFFMFDRLLPGFHIEQGFVVGLNMLPFMVNSYSLTPFWSQVLVAGIYTVLLGFFGWLTPGKK